MSGQEQQVPAASFEFLVMSLKFQAEVQLGLHQFGEHKSEPDLKLARHSIDLLAVLQEKTKGNLETAEQRMLDNSLTEMRFRYVQAVNDEARHKSEREAAEAKAPEHGDA